MNNNALMLLYNDVRRNNNFGLEMICKWQEVRAFLCPSRPSRLPMVSVPWDRRRMTSLTSLRHRVSSTGSFCPWVRQATVIHRISHSRPTQATPISLILTSFAKRSFSQRKTSERSTGVQTSSMWIMKRSTMSVLRYSDRRMRTSNQEISRNTGISCAMRIVGSRTMRSIWQLKSCLTTRRGPNGPII